MSDPSEPAGRFTEFLFDHTDVDHLYAHTVSLGAIVMSGMGYLPAFAAGAAGLWYLVQIWETKTFKDWRGVRAAAKDVKVAEAQNTAADLKAAQVDKALVLLRQQIRAAELLLQYPVPTAE